MTAEERCRKGVHAEFKAKIYKKLSDTSIFIESDPRQAKKIAQLTGKMVFCATTDELFYTPRNCGVFFYNSFVSSVIYLKKSCGCECVADKIFAILLVEGQRGCSYLENRLLLLKVVGSKPLHFARPEQESPWSRAKSSIAFQICSCVMVTSSLFFAFCSQFSKKIIITLE